MKKVIMIAAMAALMPATSAWAGDQHKPMNHKMGDNKHGAMSNTTVQKHGHRLEEGENKASGKHEKMQHKMSDNERGPMTRVDSYKKSSDRLQGKREEMKHEMDGNKHGAMSGTTSHEHGHRVE